MISYLLIIQLLPVMKYVTLNGVSFTNLLESIATQSMREHCSFYQRNGHQRRFFPLCAKSSHKNQTERPFLCGF